MVHLIITHTVILIAAPLMFAGFFRYNDMQFEQFAVEFFYHYFTPQKRVYSYEPIFMEFRNAYLSEELAAEITEKHGSSAAKKFTRKAGLENGKC